MNLLVLLSVFASFTSAKTYNATFTWYGLGDERGSPNCNSVSDACFFYTSPGYSAAVSENLYGQGPGTGAGPYCGKCMKLNVVSDVNRHSLKGTGSNVVVMVNNLCPAAGNPLCAQANLQSTNQYGATIDVNVCSDSGAREALFGSSGVGLALGTAEEVDCTGNYNGTVQKSGTGQSVASGTGSTASGFISPAVATGQTGEIGNSGSGLGRTWKGLALGLVLGILVELL